MSPSLDVSHTANHYQHQLLLPHQDQRPLHAKPISSTVPVMVFVLLPRKDVIIRLIVKTNQMNVIVVCFHIFFIYIPFTTYKAFQLLFNLQTTFKRTLGMIAQGAFDSRQILSNLLIVGANRKVLFM